MDNLVAQLTRLPGIGTRTAQRLAFHLLATPPDEANALAAEQVKYITRGESVAASETLARSNPAYIEKFKALEKAYADACGTIAEWEAIFARYEACRSMLSMARATLGL